MSGGKKELLPGVKKWLRNDTYSRNYTDPYTNVATPEWMIQTIADLKRHEGFRRYAYPDPLSYIGRKWMDGFGFRPAREILQLYQLDSKDGRPWTVGYGFTHGVSPDSEISESLAAHKLKTELIEHLEVLDKLIPEWKLMEDYVKTVLANMAYNMGYNTLKQFAATLQEFKEGNYKEAARRLRNTLWYKQVGYRAEELVTRLETGIIEEKNRVT